MIESEFDALYEGSFSRLVGQVFAMCGSRDEAQDCVQEAFIRAWDHRRTLEVDGGAEGWVRTTATRLAVSRWRRRQMDVRARDRSLTPAGPAQPSPDRIAIVRALQRLPGPQREAIVLFHMADMSVDDIARQTQTPSGTVKARLSRARAALRDLLTDTSEGEPSRA